MPTPVLATKLFAPPPRPSTVARARLVERLDATGTPGHRLTLVSAPAGFGKTTLLGEWLRGLDTRRPDLAVAWLSLDDGDNDPARFTTHLVAALRRVRLPLDEGLVELFERGPATAAMTAMVNDVLRAAEEAPERRWVLVLDDHHVIESAEVHELVAFLVEHGVDRLHLVLATRSDPPLPLSRLRTRGQLTELRAADLRFTEDESGAFLDRVMGLDLTTEHVAALGERTEGWVAGLQLAGLSLRGLTEPGSVSEFIAAFTGSNRFVIDYLTDEVLARQPEEVRDFLLRTAILHRLCGPLCDALTGRSDGARTLEELDRSNLFVVPLDDQRLWYRFHHLFADVLHARLLAEHPDEAPVLHRRASDWFAGRGQTTEAFDHALAAHDFDRAAELLERALPELRRSRQDALLQRWVRALPDEVVGRSPVLSIVAGWATLMAGDLDGAASWFDDAEAVLAAGEADPGLRAGWADTEDVRSAAATIGVYRASLAQARGDVAATVLHARRALELAADEDHFVRGAGGGFLGLAAWAAGDVQEAVATFTDAVRSLRAAGNDVDALDATIVLADMWVAAGRPGRARELYEEALRTATRTDRAWQPRATPDLHVGLAELDLEADDLAGAETHLETARRLGESGSITENRFRWFQAMAWLRAATGDLEAASRLLDEAEGSYRRGFYPELRPIPAMRARVRMAAGDLDAAVLWAGRSGVAVDDEPDYQREYDLLTLVRLLLAQHRSGGSPGGSTLHDVLRLLDRLHADAERQGRFAGLREALVLRALVHHADGDLSSALAALHASFAEVPEPAAAVRLYLDEGAPMLDLLRRCDPAHPHARRLLEHAKGRPTRQEQPLADALSGRELEVLRLLDSELTGPQIARELYVTVNTLRTHTKRIFTKLDVTTRAAAVRRARELDLL